MDILIKDGDLVMDASGNPVCVSGADEVFQRVMIAITSKKGRFIYQRELGCDELPPEDDERFREKLEARFREAVMGIGGVYLSVICVKKDSQQRLRATVRAEYMGINREEEVIL